MSDLEAATANGLKPEAIAERIRAAILEHRLAPGAKLTEAQLCEVFGVKRGPIRQALAQLATDRLVDLEPNRGAFVASPSLQEVHEVFEMRRIIELAVVEKICSGHGMRRLKSIGSMIGRERKAFETRDFPAWIRLSGEFHTELASLTGNAVLCEDVLVESGVTDLSVYDCVPGSELGVDLWVEDPNPPGYTGP